MTGAEMARKIADWCQAEATRLAATTNGQGYAPGLAAAALHARRMATEEELPKAMLPESPDY